MPASLKTGLYTNLPVCSNALMRKTCAGFQTIAQLPTIPSPQRIIVSVALEAKTSAIEISLG